MTDTKPEESMPRLETEETNGLLHSELNISVKDSGKNEKSSVGHPSPYWQEVEPIENSIDFSSDNGGGHRSVIERYFTARFCLSVCKLPRNDYCVLIHSNRVCLVSLAPSHFLVGDKCVITSINFGSDSVGGVDRLANSVSGKKKRGAQRLSVGSPLATVLTSDGNKVTVHSPIGGKLLEVNQRLMKKPSLLVDSHKECGYLALVLPEISVTEYYKHHLLTSVQYEEELEKNRSIKEDSIAE